MGKDGVLCCLGTAVNFGHPPARCARVPLRFAKGGRWSLSPRPSPIAGEGERNPTRFVVPTFSKRFAVGCIVA